MDTDNKMASVLQYIADFKTSDTRVCSVEASLRTESDAIVRMAVSGISPEIMTSILESSLYSSNKRLKLGILAIRRTAACPLVMMLDSVETVQVYIVEAMK